MLHVHNVKSTSTLESFTTCCSGLSNAWWAEGAAAYSSCRLVSPMMVLAADAVGVTYLLLLFLLCWSVCLVDVHEVEMANTTTDVAAA